MAVLSAFCLLRSGQSSVRWFHKILRECLICRPFLARNGRPQSFFRTFKLGTLIFWLLVVSWPLDRSDELLTGRRFSKPCHRKWTWFSLDNFIVPLCKRFRTPVHCRGSANTYMARVYPFKTNLVHNARFPLPTTQAFTNSQISILLGLP